MNTSLYIALDFPTGEEALHFLQVHGLQQAPVKVGMELFYREGPKIIEKLKENNHPIFLDLKLHDIPTTVYKAMQNIAKLDVDIINVHALGGKEMITRAKEGLLQGGADHTKLIAVTILTSMNETTMNQELNLSGTVENQVTNLATLSKESGADGVVCSVLEVENIKSKCGKDFLTVTPGIRLANTTVNDQKRIATPSFAKNAGADYLVVGRGITQADDPKVAYKEFLKEIEIHDN
ncbi:orotidine-5'-phosphate decarboxylase [Oceanobacillus sp. CAU 1775]